MTTDTLKLKRSNDRKVANLVTKNGKQAAIANTFGLPAGKAFSCPGATSVCESVCYAGKLEKLFKGVKANLLHNWTLLKDADQLTMETLLTEMMDVISSLVKNRQHYLTESDKARKTATQYWLEDHIQEHVDMYFPS